MTVESESAFRMLKEKPMKNREQRYCLKRTFKAGGRAMLETFCAMEEEKSCHIVMQIEEDICKKESLKELRVVDIPIYSRVSPVNATRKRII